MTPALQKSNFLFFSSSIIWGFIALIAMGLPLSNTWLGFPIPTTPEAMYNAFKIYIKRKQFQSAYLFLAIAFLGISVSACITWKGGSIRPFAVAIPFIGALIGLAFGKISAELQVPKTRENMWSVCLICFIIVSSTATPFISSFHKKIMLYSSFMIILRNLTNAL